MIQADINYLTVLVGGIICMFIGFLWYGPIFGKIWMKLSGFTEKDAKKAKARGMGKLYFVAFVCTLLINYVLAHFVDYVGAKTALDGMQTGLLIWLGFLVPVMLGKVLWEGKSFNLYLIDVTHYLVVLAVMGAIHAVWV